MRLGDINNHNAAALNEDMMKRVGWNFGNIDKLSIVQASAMLENVNGKLSAFKATKKLHESEKSSGYNGLVLAKQVLENYIAEKAESQAQQKAAGAALAAKRGDTPKSGLKGASKEMAKMSKKELEKIAGTKHKGLPEKVKESAMFEDEVGQAETIMAAQDLVDSIQDMVEDVGKMLNEKLPPLTDSIRRSNGADAASSFNQQTHDALNALMDAVRTARESLGGAVGVLSGEEPTMMGSTDEFDTELSEPELDGGVDDEINVDDFEASDAATGGDEPLGRAKRV